MLHNNYLESHLKWLLEREEEYLEILQKRMKKMPKGSISIKKTGDNLFSYVNLNGTEYGITKKKAMIQSLCNKKYLDAEISVTEKNCLLLKKIISSAHSYSEKINHLNSSLINSRIKYLVDNGVILDTDPLVRWAQASFVKNPGWPEALKYVTPLGTVVRTKSEYFIAIFLENHNIPYRYEARLEIFGEVFYPDFTLLKPDGTLIIWEHLGLHGNLEYDEKTNYKLDAYRAAGYVEHTNLICTYESDIGKENVLTNILNRYYYC